MSKPKAAYDTIESTSYADVGMWMVWGKAVFGSFHSLRLNRNQAWRGMSFQLLLTVRFACDKTFRRDSGTGKFKKPPYCLKMWSTWTAK